MTARYRAVNKRRTGEFFYEKDTFTSDHLKCIHFHDIGSDATSKWPAMETRGAERSSYRQQLDGLPRIRAWPEAILG